MQKIGDITDTADGNGEFTDGNVAGNVQPTELMAAWFNSVQRELLAVLKDAGITPDKTNDAQLVEAIQQILATGIAGSGYLISENNLSDLEDISEARGHLGLGNVGDYKAVHLGGAEGMLDNEFYAGWNGKKIIAQIDNTPMGALFYEQNPPTAAQTGAYPMAGGYLSEEASATVISNVKNGSDGQAIYAPMWRSCINGRGGDQDFKDGASACFRMVEVVSNYAFAEILVDGYGSVRSFEFRNDGSLHAPSSVYAGQGFIAPDGNLYGPVWGGYANNWILQQINALNVAINNQLNNMNADRNNCIRATARGGRQHKVGGEWIADWEAPAGCFMTGMNTNEGGDGRKAGLYFRAMYYYTPSSGWVQAGDIA